MLTGSTIKLDAEGNIVVLRELNEKKYKNASKVYKYFSVLDDRFFTEEEADAMEDISETVAENVELMGLTLEK